MNKRKIVFIFILLAACDVFLWHSVVFGGSNDATTVHFFNVGQGDSHLIELPGGAQILIDGGPDGRVLRELANVVHPADRYIDVVLLTHADADHVGGLPEVLRRYEVGAFVYNGRGADSDVWRELSDLIKAKEVPVVVVGEGDRLAWGEHELSILNPGLALLQSAAPNDAAIVSILTGGGIKTLFTADIAFTTENYILEKYDLDVDILKVAHHGSKFATSPAFLEEATPKVAVVQVGKNRYGHPTQEVLNRLQAALVRLYRNDRDGTVSVSAHGDSLRVERH